MNEQRSPSGMPIPGLHSAEQARSQVEAGQVRDGNDLIAELRRTVEVRAAQLAAIKGL